MIADVYPNGDKSIKYVAIMNSALTIFMAAAPPIGGLINQTLGWQGSYWVVALICLISWIFILGLLPETKKELQKLELKNIFKNYYQLFTHPYFLYASMVPSMLYSGYLCFVVVSIP